MLYCVFAPSARMRIASFAECGSTEMVMATVLLHVMIDVVFELGAKSCD